MQEKSHAMTLIELLFSLIMLFFIALAVVSIETFVRAQTFEADLKAQLQNENLIILEHISKQVGSAIGNELLYGANNVTEVSSTASTVVLRAYVDGNENGVRDPGGPDHWITYRWYNKNNTDAAARFQVRYCSNCSTQACTFPGECSGNIETISGFGALGSRRIADLGLQVNKDASGRLVENFIFANITACKDPQSINLTANPSGTTDNPCITMQSRILLPSVTTN